MDKQKILIVEDEERVARLLSEYLTASGFEALMIHNGLEAVDTVKRENPDLILLDLMLPGKDGLEIAKEVRRFSDMPLIMITARVEEIDRLLGLELGADDYICKPFSFREVVARVKAVLRRHNRIPGYGSGYGSGDGPGEAGKDDRDKGVALDESRHLLVIEGRKLTLTAIEFQLFKAMAGQPGMIFTRDMLMDRIYTDGRVVSDRTIDSHIRKLRKKIKTLLPDREIIHSVYSVGYKYEY